MKPLVASACAKIILLGEHAVVYRQPAIAIPLSTLRAYATRQPSDTPVIVLQEERITPSNATHPLITLLNLVCEFIQQPLPPIAIHVDSQIPIASGLGSGAAIATAIARLICAHYNVTLPQASLNNLIYETEKIFHSTPSGIDNTVIVYEKPILFVKGAPVEFVDKFQPFKLLIANTGITAPTYESVSDVRRLYERSPEEYSTIFAEIGSLVTQGLACMQRGDWQTLGALMTRNHALLQTLTVSCAELDALVEAALANGAWGAKLSGGGRGGNMIVLAPEAQIESMTQALYAAGAVHVMQVEVGEHDHHTA